VHNTEHEQQYEAPTLVRVQDLTVHYPVRGGLPWKKRVVHAVDHVSLTIRQGEVLGLVGESGCGKTTIGRQLIALERPTSGSVWFRGRCISEMTAAELQPLRPKMQMIFQDNYSALNPRKHVRDILLEPMLYHGMLDRRDKDGQSRRLGELLDMVGLPHTALGRYPHEFSGGQRQRIGIARALALSPELIVCDEPVSALDVSIQAQILNLLRSLQKELNLTMLFIGHGLGAVRYVSDRVAVMYMGQIVEIAPSDSIFANPIHPYTRALCRAIPLADPGARDFTEGVLRGEVGDSVNPPVGCRFHPRCPMARPSCGDGSVRSQLRIVGESTMCACPYAKMNDQIGGADDANA
jgi:oligopeptide transport system ATP-binding protein